MLCNVNARGLYYKTLRLRNLCEKDRFCCKLVSFISSVTSALSQTNTLAYQVICTLQTRNALQYRPQGPLSLYLFMGATTLNTMTLNIMALNTMALSKVTFSITINEMRHSLRIFVMLSAVMLSVIMLNVVAPFLWWQ